MKIVRYAYFFPTAILLIILLSDVFSSDNIWVSLFVDAHKGGWIVVTQNGLFLTLLLLAMATAVFALCVPYAPKYLTRIYLICVTAFFLAFYVSVYFPPSPHDFPSPVPAILYWLGKYGTLLAAVAGFFVALKSKKTV